MSLVKFCKHSMRRNGQTTFENFWTTKNIHFGTKHDVFGPKFGFLLTLTTYIEVWGHMIAQNDALDGYKKLCYQNFFGPTEKNCPWGPKMAIFGQNLMFFGQNWPFSDPKGNFFRRAKKFFR